MNDCAIRLPKTTNGWVSTTIAEKNESHLYADLKFILEETNPLSHMYLHHRVFSVGYYVHCSYDNSISFYRFRCDKYCVAFVEQLRDLVHNVKTITTANIPMVDFDYEKLTTSRTLTCAKNRSCWQASDKRVRDHCHLTSRYRSSSFKLQPKL